MSIANMLTYFFVKQIYICILSFTLNSVRATKAKFIDIPAIYGLYLKLNLYTES